MSVLYYFYFCRLSLLLCHIFQRKQKKMLLHYISHKHLSYSLPSKEIRLASSQWLLLVWFWWPIMLDHTLPEVGSLGNHVRCERKQALLSCGTSIDCCCRHVLFDFKSVCCCCSSHPVADSAWAKFLPVVFKSSQRSLESLETFWKHFLK